MRTTLEVSTTLATLNYPTPWNLIGYLCAGHFELNRLFSDGATPPENIKAILTCGCGSTASCKLQPSRLATALLGPVGHDLAEGERERVIRVSRRSGPAERESACSSEGTNPNKTREKVVGGRGWADERARESEVGQRAGSEPRRRVRPKAAPCGPCPSRPLSESTGAPREGVVPARKGAGARRRRQLGIRVRTRSHRVRTAVIPHGSGLGG